jgi:hydrogenase maturation protein HypF
LTSSIGRLFDAVSFLANLRKEASYEAQGPMELESLCTGRPEDFYRFDIFTENNMLIIDPARVICSILNESGPNKAKIISEKFHSGIVDMIKNMVFKISHTTNIKNVVLSGGVFQNKTILERTINILEENGFQVFTNKNVPANDGGISLGQVYYVISGLLDER